MCPLQTNRAIKYTFNAARMKLCQQFSNDMSGPKSESQVSCGWVAKLPTVGVGNMVTSGTKKGNFQVIKWDE